MRRLFIAPLAGAFWIFAGATGLHADILLDDFSVNTVQTLAQPGGAPVELTPNVDSLGLDREIVLTAANPSSVTAAVSGGVLSVSGSGAGQVEIEYTGAPFDASAETFFQVNFTGITGTPRLKLELGSTNSPTLVTSFIDTTASAGPVSFSFDLMDILTTTYGLSSSQALNYLEGINRTYILLNDPSSGSFTTNTDSMQFIPEPQTYVMLGLGTLLVAWQCNRRRRVSVKN